MIQLCASTCRLKWHMGVDVLQELIQECCVETSDILPTVQQKLLLVVCFFTPRVDLCVLLVATTEVTWLYFTEILTALVLSEIDVQYHFMWVRSFLQCFVGIKLTSNVVDMRTHHILNIRFQQLLELMNCSMPQLFLHKCRCFCYSMLLIQKLLSPPFPPNVRLLFGAPCFSYSIVLSWQLSITVSSRTISVLHTSHRVGRSRSAKNSACGLVHSPPIPCLQLLTTKHIYKQPCI